jgi:hypothetical protein
MDMNGKGIRRVRCTADEAYTVQPVNIIINNNAALSFLYSSVSAVVLVDVVYSFSFLLPTRQ